MLPTLYPFQPDYSVTVNCTCIRAQMRVFDMINYFWKTQHWTSLPGSYLLLQWIYPVLWQRLVRKRDWVGFKALLSGLWGRGTAVGGMEKGRGGTTAPTVSTALLPNQELILENHEWWLRLYGPFNFWSENQGTQAPGNECLRKGSTCCEAHCPWRLWVPVAPVKPHLLEISLFCFHFSGKEGRYY